MSKPSILLIPGSFCLPELYDPVIDAVKAKGYDFRGLHLPSVGVASGQGRDGMAPSMHHDANFIAEEVEKIADDGSEVMLIAHSYGGVPVTQSTKGLGIDERQQQGKKGGIARIAYITSVVPAVGVSAAGVLEAVPEEQKVDMKVDDNGWMYHDNPPSTAAITLNNLSPEDGLEWVKKFAKHSAASFGSELTHAGYKNIPVSYLSCEEDRCIPLEIQRAEIAMIEKESGSKVDVTTIKSDHCPNITATQETIDWILKVIEKVEKLSGK